MSKKQASKGSVNSAATRDISLDLFGAALSATCRMVVPVFVLFIIGLLVDVYLKQMAFYAIIGAVLGFVVASWLIYRLITKYQKNAAETAAKTRARENK